MILKGLQIKVEGKPEKTEIVLTKMKERINNIKSKPDNIVKNLMRGKCLFK